MNQQSEPRPGECWRGKPGTLVAAHHYRVVSIGRKGKWVKVCTIRLADIRLTRGVLQRLAERCREHPPEGAP